MPSVSKKQHNLMAAVANNPAFAKKVGIPQSVGQEFNKADKGKTFRKGGEMKKMNPGMMAIMAKKKPMMKKVAAKAVKGHEKRLHGMAKGGGVEIKGKTKGKMIKMNKGGRTC
jgi:hypothetical protein